MELQLLNEPTVLLFLHGVGDGDQNDTWKRHLADALNRLGYASLDSVSVVAPKYAHALKGWDDKVPLPEVTIKRPSREEARRNRREFERRMGAVEFRLGRHDHGSGHAAGDALIDGAMFLPQFVQAQKYIKEPEVRAQVLTRILGLLPETGRLVVVAHSLGSVIAADLLRRLPIGLEVVGMITMGSPLANGNFDVDKLRNSLEEPPANLAWWVNFWNALDPVAAHRGLSSVFPWLVDFRINSTKQLHHAHDAAEYLADDAVAEAIGFALFGSKSKEVARVEQGLDIPLDAAERLALLALRYAHLLKARLKGELQDRFSGALRRVHATVVDDIKRRNISERRPMPSEIARLAFDLSDPRAVVPEPLPSAHIGKEDAVVFLTVLASENVIRPFEISIGKDEWQAAMEELSAEMGLGTRFGTDVFVAAKEAQEVLSGGRGKTWIKWGALGVGAVALVIATGGLALAAAPGLAGAAAITSALAAFGPGGMVGGLLTAGTLIGAGGGGIAFGLASPGTTAETLEAVVERQLAAEILRKSQRIPQDRAVWRNLVETEIEVRRQHERLDEFSDASASSLKELKRKITAVERALKFMRDNGLEPGVPPQEH
ncbi:hypothetical protein OH146_01570 [Salinibacterium sp. SYSU T00001]|uniref:hypothetical protein n=1 Tax=Homoserinimonas sedimenticola TaxID=2986805 RepID=UPI002235759E|nr:hypothetical protein [Salinibacterium sedimenticola]MCW4384458.1 hypothetical protein [Salinibacterium sedimenticola]